MVCSRGKSKVVFLFSFSKDRTDADTVRTRSRGNHSQEISYKVCAHLVHVIIIFFPLYLTPFRITSQQLRWRCDNFHQTRLTTQGPNVIFVTRCPSCRRAGDKWLQSSKVSPLERLRPEMPPVSSHDTPRSG